ncbi:leucine-rich repeat and death domain-containing protein 1-like [Leguminivora glycinivorella]|uniref:leucine-rich repeat and death domain-containing protein 1-like n=1 Tax=Leguminivora glycinivorella TaxID=1035111 RepID=UPI00200C06EF|nr:leucine-rich repeat and death domain-containing protein 1-like [Leguminivora glycinivorella]
MTLTLIKYFLFVFLSFWQVSDLASTCPEKCTCHNNLTLSLKCSYNVTLKENQNVYHVSVCCDEEEQTWRQEFANKTLSEVMVRYCSACGGADLAAPALDTYSLAITNNNISKIAINVNNRNLRQINLSDNRLKSITKGLFNNFSSLQKLILSRNEIISIFPESFNGLSRLELLDLSENNLTILANVFTPLKNLQHLNLSRNNIEFIHENYFNNWLLQHLDVSHNNLKKMEPGALQLLPNLARLLLTDNPHLGITQLDRQLLVGTGRRLQQIDASRTGLYQVPEAFTHSVRFLSLVGNQISSVRCGDLDSYPLLQSLDFSDNKIVSVEDDSLGRLEMLLLLNINKNILTSVPKSLPDELKYLSVNDNLVKNLSRHDFKSLPNLRILLLKNNQIRYIEDHVFDDLLSLEMLDLSNNPIQVLSSNTFDGPLSLRDLRLCYLNVSVPAQDGSFPVPSPESVQMLHLQASPGLARQLLADSAALAAFSHLQYLDLRMNNLSEIRNDLLFYLSQLKTLRLHGNSLNCSAKMWLKDWMNWNQSTSNGESCYYSTSEAKEDIIKYNCTFPETFTISESLPPVNLYSTEMINKLLRYYGFLNNKTEKNFEYTKRDKIKHNSVSYDYESKLNKTVAKYTKYANSSVSGEKKDSIKMKNAIKFPYYDYLNETMAIKSRESSKILEQNKLLHDQLNIDQRFLDTEPNLSPALRDSKKGNEDDIPEIRQNNKSGKRLNTPVEAKKLLQMNLVKNESHPATLLNVTHNEIGLVVAGGNQTADANEKSQFSPYQSPHTNYAQYMGTVAVSVLIVMSLILWISFRLRYRRRRVPIVEVETEDQIEVSNISGGVLW